MAAEPAPVTPGSTSHMHSSVACGPTVNLPAAGGRASNARADFLERVSMAEKRDDEAIAGILSPEQRLAGGLYPDESRIPIKGRGVCNPLVDTYMPNTREATGGVQLMPNMGGNYTAGESKCVGAAGERSSHAWRSSHNYMANGAESYGDFRSEHLALQANMKARAAAPSPQQSRRHLQSESKVVLGGNPGGLYPHSPSMIRGKHPGY